MYTAIVKIGLTAVAGVCLTVGGIQLSSQGNVNARTRTHGPVGVTADANAKLGASARVTPRLVLVQVGANLPANANVNASPPASSSCGCDANNPVLGVPSVQAAADLSANANGSPPESSSSCGC
jgi:hypothetical protein